MNKLSITVQIWPFSLAAIIFIAVKYFGYGFAAASYWNALWILAIPFILAFLFIALFAIWGSVK